MLETIQIWLEDAEKTKNAGKYLAKSLYGNKSTILLTGDLGAGKTTLLQGFGVGLGLDSMQISSPTYALEQSYDLPDGRTFTHIDLYRLSEDQAAKFMTNRDDHHTICCIEWAERTDHEVENAINIQLEEHPEKEGRLLTISFNDIPLPSSAQIAAWREEVMLPPHIISHCDAVGNLAEELAYSLINKGIIVRPKVAKVAGYLHDLLRFVDFHPGGKPTHHEDGPEQLTCWNSWKDTYPDMRHEPACAAFLEDHEYHSLGEIVRTHGLRLPEGYERSTMEQILVYYADKRCMLDTVVPLEERFADFKKRYAEGKNLPEQQEWYKEAQEVEHWLFPEGTPS